MFTGHVLPRGGLGTEGMGRWCMMDQAGGKEDRAGEGGTTRTSRQYVVPRPTGRNKRWQSRRMWGFSTTPKGQADIIAQFWFVWCTTPVPHRDQCPALIIVRSVRQGL